MKYPDLALVTRIIEDVADEVILPRFGKLAVGDISSKTSPSDVVTIADREAEELLKTRLSPLTPGAAFIGEEAASADPSILSNLMKGAAWVVDPVDGTLNFASGLPWFGVQVAYVVDGEPLMGWLYDPIRRRHIFGAAGEGAQSNGKPIHLFTPNASNAMHGAVSLRLATPEIGAQIGGRLSRLGSYVTYRCAMQDYASICDGILHFALWGKTYPWDHAPGVAILRAAGGVARRLDGRAYRVSDAAEDPHLLIAASSQATWDLAVETLFSINPLE